jgi:zona occludens toxin (predicted ATPase)
VLTADDSATTLSFVDYHDVTMAPLFAGRGDASGALEQLSRQRAVAVSPCKCVGGVPAVAPTTCTAAEAALACSGSRGVACVRMAGHRVLLFDVEDTEDADDDGGDDS